MNKTEKSEVLETLDLKYKGGYVQCQCGYKKELGDGFNGYLIDGCPACEKVKTLTREKVTYFDKRINNLVCEHGTHTYFILSNGIHVRYAAVVTNRTYPRTI